MKIYDGRNSFYQWDLNQKLTSDTLQPGDEVHYSNLKQTKALVTVAYELDGCVVSDVPNILLQDAHLMHVERYIKIDDSKYTIEQYAFKVKQKAKPSDYIYTETKVKDWEELHTRLDEIEELLKKETPGMVTTDRIQDNAITIDKISHNFADELLKFHTSDDIIIRSEQLDSSKQLNITAFLANKTTEINKESTDDQTPTAKAVYDFANTLQHIKNITEDIYVYDLDSGIYNFNGNDQYCLFFDDFCAQFLSRGIIFVNKVENFCYWSAIGFDNDYYGCILNGHTTYHNEMGKWVVDEDAHLEQQSNKKNTILIPNDSDYPTTQAVVDYAVSKEDVVQEIDPDKTYEDKQIFSANAINKNLVQVLLSGEYVELVSNKVNEIDPENCTHIQYPSARAVCDLCEIVIELHRREVKEQIVELEELIGGIENGSY